MSVFTSLTQLIWTSQPVVLASLGLLLNEVKPWIAVVSCILTASNSPCSWGTIINIWYHAFYEK